MISSPTGTEVTDVVDPSTETVCSAFNRTVARYPDVRALSTPGDGPAYTYAEYAAAVADTAAALHGLGVRRGDVLLLMFENRPMFHIVDMAAVHLGATTCSIYNTSPVSDIRHIIANSSPVAAVCEPAFLTTLDDAIGGRFPLITSGSATDRHRALAALDRPRSFDLAAHRDAVHPDDIATLIYTSGTTGTPKGVELSHRAVMADVHLAAELLAFRAGDRVPSAMPMAHAAQRWGTHYSAAAFALDVVCIPDVKQLVPSLPQIRPNIWGTVPRVLEKIVAALTAKFGGLPDETARPAVLAALGLQDLRWLVVGAAPTPPHVMSYLEALGLTIVEVWGMTELGAVATVNPIGRQRAGSVGVPLRNVEIRIAADGEVLVRGPIQMTGYRADAVRTAEAIDADGWMHTGDIGKLDADGYLSIVDRKKELLVTASGKNISPQRVEAAVKAESPLVGSVVALGDGRPYVSALVVLDPDVAASRAAAADIPVADFAAAPEVAAEIAAAVTRANESLARVEQIKRHTVLPDQWLPGGTELTPTMKLRRRPIAEKYAQVIARLYETEEERNR